MEDRDITVEEQRAYNHEIMVKAEKGETTVKVIAALSIICSLMNLVTGDGAFLVRAVACAISIFIAIKLTEGRQWSRILFMLSA